MAPKLKNLGAILKFLGAMAPKITLKKPACKPFFIQTNFRNHKPI